MQKLALVLAALLALGAAHAPRSLSIHTPNSPHLSGFIRSSVGLDLCPTCVEFTGEAINMLLNLILNAGIVGSCGSLCNALEQKTGSQALGVVCDLLCDIVGIEEFVKLIQKADLDPIYFCELLKTCPINDNGDATITGLSIDPVKGPQGPRTISFTLNSKNGTGTGELVLLVKTVDGMPIEDSMLLKAENATAFPAPQSLSLKAEQDPNCDPSQGPCEQWLAGNYTLMIDVCNGECGSNHPHSKIYDRKEVGFEITEQ
ncbi:countin-3-like [Littorina saxatilis]|uniref:Saposin B-type domain-containing protein n=1 Tax=Littorina saxatilis TaxID=31220 RepID=A0AAN9GCJ3_9CAEN